MPDFRTTKVFDREHQPFEAGMLPDSEKERLCRALLSEFGVTSIRVQDNGEMIHSCCLPTGGHKHGDASASASLNYKKLTYNCFGCGSSGGLLWFIALCRGEDTDDSHRWLADQTGTGPDEQSLASLLEFFEAVYVGESRIMAAPIPKMSPTVLNPWARMHPYMFDPQPDGRGVPEETLIRFQVGYAEAYRLKIKAPLGREHEADADGRISILSPRIVIPHYWKGNLVGWQTRRLIDDGSPKYQSSPDFPKDQTLYNYDEKRRSAIIVESPLSVLRHVHHVPEMEGTFGAKMTDRQCALISIHPRVVSWLDNDKAGWQATERLGAYLEAYSDHWVVECPWNADPADLPDEEVDRLSTEALVPYSLWNSPKVLYCWRCKNQAHDGECS